MDCSFISEIPPKIWEIISEKFGGKITINQLRKIRNNVIHKNIKEIEIEKCLE